MKNTRTPIDLVYLWVDGNDIEWVKKKHAFLGNKTNLNVEALSIARNANNEELKFSLRSVEQYAPWIRHIYIVTDQQKPNWLDTSYDKVSIVDIRDILPTEALPCYNSVVIEYFFYRIKGLSEHFLYANDDMFFNKPIGPEFFFNQKGYPIVRLQRTFLGKLITSIKKKLGVYSNIYRKTVDLAASQIERKFGKYYTGMPHHNIDAYLKSDYKALVEDVFADEIKPLITHHTRQETDLQRIIFLYYALAINKGELRYVNREESARIRVQKKDYASFIKKYKPALFCLNDTHRATNEDRKRIKPFLSEILPEKSKFEL